GNRSFRVVHKDAHADERHVEYHRHQDRAGRPDGKEPSNKNEPATARPDVSPVNGPQARRRPGFLPGELPDSALQGRTSKLHDSSGLMPRKRLSRTSSAVGVRRRSWSMLSKA